MGSQSVKKGWQRMITQKDVHNLIVEQLTPLQKATLSYQLGNDQERIAKMEQTIADVMNGIVKSFENEGMIYLNTKK